MSSPKNLFEPLPHEIEHPTLKKSRLTQDEKLLTVSKNQKSLLVFFKTSNTSSTQPKPQAVSEKKTELKQTEDSLERPDNEESSKSTEEVDKKPNNKEVDKKINGEELDKKEIKESSKKRKADQITKEAKENDEDQDIEESKSLPRKKSPISN